MVCYQCVKQPALQIGILKLYGKALEAETAVS